MARAIPLFLLILFLSFRPPVYGYSVLTHEAVVDSAWDDVIVKILRQRFPNATAADLKDAHAYAYGGCIIADMGYYPFGSHLFTDLTHYVRSADFVRSMLHNAQDIQEYAFALGSLAHYASDNVGHPGAINRVVPMLYPKLRRKFGDHVSYADDPGAHLKTEFGFDVLQVARGLYSPDSYRDFIGFEVSKPLLERAFQETYGIELKDIFMSLDLAIGTYRKSVSTIIPKMTQVAWETKEDDIVKQRPEMKRSVFLYRLKNSEFDRTWGRSYRKPGPGTKFLALLIRVIPRIGPFKALAFRVPTPQAEKLFLETFDLTTKRYRSLLAAEQAHRLNIPDENFDLGVPSKAGAYKPADDAYAELIERLSKRHFQDASPLLRQALLSFYRDQSAPISTKRHPERWEKLQAQLSELNRISDTR